MVVAKLYKGPIDLTKPVDVSMESQRISFYPNGKPYTQFYLEKGQPARSVIYFTREGETDQVIDLSKHLPGEEVLIRNPWDFRMKRKQIRVLIK